MTGTASPADARSVAVVIPAYNEAAVIGGVVREVLAHYPSVIVVDDGSADETGALARQAGATVLRHLVNRGQGAALQTGIEYAVRTGAEVVVTFDADGQHQVSDVANLAAPIRARRCDVVLGSRFLDSADAIPPMRRLLLRAAVIFARVVSGVRLTDAHNGLRALSADAARSVRIQIDEMAHASEIIDDIVRAGLRFEEVPVHIRYTEYSMAKGQHGGHAFKIVARYFLERILR